MKFVNLKAIAALIAFSAAVTERYLSDAAIQPAAIQGYRIVSTVVVCQADLLCSNVLGPICKNGNFNLYGKDPQGIDCSMIVYRYE